MMPFCDYTINTGSAKKDMNKDICRIVLGLLCCSGLNAAQKLATLYEFIYPGRRK